MGLIFIIHVADELSLVFQRRDNGFYVCNMLEDIDNLRVLADERKREEATLLVTSVHDKEINYSKREIRDAERARELQRALGYPSRYDIVSALHSGVIL